MSSAAATRGDWIMVAALALVLAPTPFTAWVVATAWRRYTGRADHCIEIAMHAHNRCAGKTDGDKIEREFVKHMTAREYM